MEMALERAIFTSSSAPVRATGSALPAGLLADCPERNNAVLMENTPQGIERYCRSLRAKRKKRGEHWAR
ncbi:MAG: hypothetical protein ACLR9W_07645 [Enterobacter hormaechei]